jgi:hypothetical protein
LSNNLKQFILRFLKPIVYIGVTTLILIIGIFIPGLGDEAVLETAWIIVIAIFEAKSKLSSRK